jgi:hypothetical protein
MKAITIKQPWASLIIEGGKDIENRTRRTHVRGWVLVHAGLSWCLPEYEAFEFCRTRRLHEKEAVAKVLREPNRHLGGIIGAMHIADCVDDSYSPWFCAPFGCLIDRVVKLPFLPCRGHLGWFDVQLPPEMEALIPTP